MVDALPGATRHPALAAADVGVLFVPEPAPATAAAGAALALAGLRRRRAAP